MSKVIIQKNSLKKKLLRGFFCLEIILFSCLYLFGAQGMRALHQLRATNVALDQELTLAQSQVTDLQQEILAWKSDPFYQEKLAREHLHMAKPNELIFYINQERS